jgi:lysophospholipase L1-like esterase
MDRADHLREEFGLSVSKPRLLWRAFLVSASVLAALIALEVAVRFVSVFDRNYLDEIASPRSLAPDQEVELGDLVRQNADDSIVYELRPGARCRFRGVPVAINALGMRDSERTLEKAPQAVRIVGIGDSLMFGWGVRQEQAFLSLLEKRLNASSSQRTFEVWNLAVPGYNSVQEVATFAAKAERIRPDLVIVSWVGNDMELPTFFAERPNIYSLRHSFLFDLARRRWRVWRGKRVRPTLVQLPVDQTSRDPKLEAAEVPERYRPLLGTENMLQALDRLAGLAREYRIRPVVLFDWNTPQADPARAESHSASRIAVKEWCAARGYLVVDTEQRVVQYLRSNHLDASVLWLSASDPHPSVLRHRLIAEELVDALLRSGAIQGVTPSLADGSLASN